LLVALFVRSHVRRGYYRHLGLVHLENCFRASGRLTTTKKITPSLLLLLLLLQLLVPLPTVTLMRKKKKSNSGRIPTCVPH